ncbi:hypothetical protein [Aeromonas sp. MrichA-1]|uniref:hypothetical protein n=1 Tax=Aeromonas sp. MrichA-1 TaxID=2823362 RepID=UPI001B31C968|nr:hypothetical protein [Aeromonas sp. MrichA-1]MBP4081463.1 hypothetical protein [Aeromonas sp. MrichA-1]
MRKNEYFISPSELQKNKSFCGLSFELKSVYRALLDFLWMEDSQYSCVYDLNYIEEKTGIKKELVEEVVSILDAGDKPLLSQVFCFENGMMLSSESLRVQVNKFIREEEEKEKEIERLNKKISESTMASRVGRTFNEDDLTIGHKSKSEQDLTKFSGWIPTINFQRNGQVFYVRQPLIDEMERKYPSIDVHNEIERAFFWLCKNEEGRRVPAKMNKFIDGWMARATNKQTNVDNDNIRDVEEAINQMAKELSASIAV